MLRDYTPAGRSEITGEERTLTRRLSTPRLITAGFLALMALGTLLLKLPASTKEGGISWLDAAFVSVSASSVTGLTTVSFPTTFTTFGKTAVMGLIQLGGLGIMTFTTLAAVIAGQRVGFRDLLAVREQLESIDSPRNTVRLVVQIAKITFAVELLGAAALSAGFILHGAGVADGIFQGVFHAVMAFCNSGFATLPNGDLLPYAGDWLVVGTLAVLITLGGLGFPVLVNLYSYRKVRRLTLHSKLVLITSAALIILGVLSVALLEWTNPATLGGESLNSPLAISVFQSITPRTAGFSTVDYTAMHDPTLVLQTVLMFIGAAPTSTGGGIRVTTVALVVLIIVAQVRGRQGVSAFGRELPRQLIGRALTILALASLLILASTLALMVSDGLPLLPALFEVTSAFGTVGLTLDVTPGLSPFGKVLTASLMFLGRVGPITLIVALAERQRPPHYSYPSEEIAIG
ncbi:MAG: Trk family potassium uptake protein [Actinomycetota bacterium]|nr:Trk family potassium uptake protein [Actinomycetota bacterium]